MLAHVPRQRVPQLTASVRPKTRDVPLKIVAVLALVAFLFVISLPARAIVLGARSGWHHLTTDYQLREPFRGKKWRFVTGRMGSAIGFSLTVGATDYGLYLEGLWLLGVGCPPVLIPWNHISVCVRRGWLLNRYDFRLGWPGVTLTLGRRMANNIAQVAGESWPLRSQRSV